MSTYTYLATDFTNLNVVVLHRKALNAGYTNPVVVLDGSHVPPNEPLSITVDEIIDKTVLRDNIEAAVEATLSVDKTILQISGDGVATGTVTITDSRGAAAAGKNCLLRVYSGSIKVTPASQPLGATGGEAVFIIGPSPLTNMCSGPIVIGFELADGSAREIKTTVQFV